MGLKQQKDANFNTSMQSSHQNPDPKSQQKKKSKENLQSPRISGAPTAALTAISRTIF
jgi:hypothetical protein